MKSSISLAISWQRTTGKTVKLMFLMWLYLNSSSTTQRLSCIRVNSFSPWRAKIWRFKTTRVSNLWIIRSQRSCLSSNKGSGSWITPPMCQLLVNTTISQWQCFQEECWLENLLIDLLNRRNRKRGQILRNQQVVMLPLNKTTQSNTVSVALNKRKNKPLPKKFFVS
jgi:hypothetical protein